MIDRFLFNFIFLTSLILVCCNCSFKDDNASQVQNLIEQTLDSAINSFTYKSLDSTVLVHLDFFPDTLRGISSIILKNRSNMDSISDVEKFLSLELSKKVVEKVNFSFKEPYRFGNNFIYKEDTTKDLTENKNFFGTVNLSDPVFTKDGKFGCYYFALNCYHVRKGGCTFSSAVFCKKIDKIWRIQSLVMLYTY